MATKAAPRKPRAKPAQAEEKNLASIMKLLLADEFVLYTKLRNYHWNVRGPNFLTLHRLFEEQYDALALVIDEIAEDIRAQGVMAPGTLDEFKKLTRLSEKPGVYPDWRTMVKELVADHESLVKTLEADIEFIDDEIDDDAAEKFLTELVDQHQKMAWLLQMHLEE